MEVRKGVAGSETKSGEASASIWFYLMMVFGGLYFLVILFNALYTSNGQLQMESGTVIAVYYELILVAYYFLLLIKIYKGGVLFSPVYAYLAIADVAASMIVLAFPFSSVFQGLSTTLTPEGLNAFISLLDVPELDILFISLLAGPVGLLYLRKRNTEAGK